MWFRVWLARLVSVATWGSVALVVSGYVRLSTHAALGSETFLSAAIGLTGTLTAISLALVFLTAQISANTKPLAVRQLYKESGIYLLLLPQLVGLAMGLLALSRVVAHDLLIQAVLVDSTLILSLGSLFLLPITLLTQIEYLDPLRLMRRLTARLTVRSIAEYGLTIVRTGSQGLLYELATVGIRPREVDPLRPVHEVLMEAVRNRDRVLFGKLIRELIDVVARVHGIRVSPHPEYRHHPAAAVVVHMRRWRYSQIDRLHVTLAILHYCVKRTRNLKKEWEGLDIGRHGVVTAISDLVLALSRVPSSNKAIQIALYALLRINRLYADVKAYGRIEPLNAFFPLMEILVERGFPNEALLCAEILGWTVQHTSQLDRPRVGSLDLSMSLRVRPTLIDALAQSAQDPNWLPGNAENDPWRNWP